MDCLDENVLLALAQGQLNWKANAHIAAHLDECTYCRKALAVVIRMSLRSQGDGALLTERVSSRVNQVLSPSSGADLVDLVAGSGPTFGRYQLIERIGAGGMGTVFAAYDPALDRRVAIKMVHPGLAEQGIDARLKREGQLLGKLSHPNVVAVYDSGIVEGRLFIAMEWVDGVTLRTWGKETGRTPREILAAMLQAGAGLAAAHHKGLIHRDFKPENVLVHHSGRVYVTDFGLARSVNEVQALSSADVSGAAADSPLTTPGTMLGTIAYMAPELLNGGIATQQSDQYAFAATFYELLTDKRPFQAKTIEALRADMARGECAPLGAHPGLPARSIAALNRALRRNPQERFPSMEDLLEHLKPAPVRRRRLGWAAGVGLVVLLAAGAAREHYGRQGCLQATRPELIWNESTRAKLAESFRATGHWGADDLLQMFETHLRPYLGRLAESQRDLCVAQLWSTTPARSAQSECLAQRRGRVAALIRALTLADRLGVDEAGHAALALPAIEPCLEARASSEPQSPQMRAEVSRLRNQLQEAIALKSTKSYRDALKELEQATVAATQLGFAPLLAEVLVEKAEVEQYQGLPEAEKHVREALLASLDARDDELTARCWLLLAQIQGVGQHQYPEASWSLQQVEKLLPRSANSDWLVARYLLTRGANLMAAGQEQQSLEYHLKATRLTAAPAVYRAKAHMYLGIAFGHLAQWADSEKHFDESVRIYSQALGPHHTEVGTVLGNWALRIGRREPARAAAMLLRAKGILERSLGPNSKRVGMVAYGLGNAYLAAGQLEQAEESFLRAIDIHRANPNQTLGTSISKLALVYVAQGKGPQALKAAEEGLDLQLKYVSAHHPSLAHSYVALGEAYAQVKRGEDSNAAFSKAVGLSLAESAHAETYFTWAKARLQAGDRRDAIAKAHIARKKLLTLSEKERSEAEAMLLTQVEAWLRGNQGL